MDNDEGLAIKFSDQNQYCLDWKETQLLKKYIPYAIVLFVVFMNIIIIYLSDCK